MATANGAQALGLPETGGIAVGLRADLAVFDLTGPGRQPLYDPRAALVYANAGLQAEAVYVDGVPLLENGKFLTVDAERVLREAGTIGEKYKAVLGGKTHV